MKNILHLSGGPIRISSYVIVFLLFVQCVGPRGPRGLDGQNGQDGIDGINYTHSVIYDVNPEDWGGDANGFTSVLTVPEITDDIYYNGAVLVYRLVELSPKSFNMLPYTYMDNLLTIYMDYDAYVGEIDLIYKEVYNGANDTFAPTDAMAFKVVIIDGVPLSTLKKVVDVRDYNAVAKLLKMDNSPANNLVY